MLRTIVRIIIFFILLLCFYCSCAYPPNNPYRQSEDGENFYYDTFNMPPKHLDPARSYSSDEGTFICQIYEPVVQYHFLKRPYELEPLTAESLPEPHYYEFNNEIHVDYQIRIKKGIRYQPHPCFAKDSNGKLFYHDITENDVRNFLQLKDFPLTGTRELKAADYVLQIKRLADPRMNCPIFSTISKYILGFTEYNIGLQEILKRERMKRKEENGFLYNQIADEQENPILLDYNSVDLPGVVLIDDYTFKITLKKKYPQIKYWLAMTFFAPIPHEALSFYSQGPLIERNITLDRFPVGTGPYYIESYLPNKEIVLARNPNYHPDFYPETGERTDYQKGLLKDAGLPIPFIDKAIYKQEKEYITSWNKFLQGYYDTSGISSDSFDQAIQLSDRGIQLTDDLRSKGIGLVTAVTTSIWYFGFNMSDDVVGGYDEKKCKLRQAISIAVNTEELIDIFHNGRAIPAHSIIPPGIFGYIEGKEGMNPLIYDWDAKKNRPVRKSIDVAKQLLAEAGYPNGIGPDGKQLVIYFDNMLTGSSSAPYINWIIKQFKKLNIHLESRTTDYNRFRDKIRSGNFQFFSWGWNADYPDPENFMFLLYGPNSRMKNQGENSANYDNPVFNTMFQSMENIENSEERLRIIKKMNQIIQHDAPLHFGFFSVGYSLHHNWYKNVKPNLIGRNTLKYKKIDGALRRQMRLKWNKPVSWPLIALFIIFVIFAVPASISIWRRNHSYD